MKTLKVVSPPDASERLLELAATQAFDHLIGNDERAKEQLADLAALVRENTLATKQLGLEINRMERTLRKQGKDIVEMRKTITSTHTHFVDLCDALTEHLTK